ncbi:diguanylate cyclase domain-containing protein [Paraburkholderia caribensis]|uniref:diguanylate cyclase domain-containing protein n=1 Tax=Paraburkholderia caribensis TaxID=75105 RepID=UPI0009EF1F02|nr:diguanylate cyclase [Paraburkholderia caribensis]
MSPAANPVSVLSRFLRLTVANRAQVSEKSRRSETWRSSSLTGLRNRRYLDSWIEQRLRSQNCHPSAEAVAILFADVDHFKNFNGELWAR